MLPSDARPHGITMMGTRNRGSTERQTDGHKWEHPITSNKQWMDNWEYHRQECMKALNSEPERQNWKISDRACPATVRHDQDREAPLEFHDTSVKRRGYKPATGAQHILATALSRLKLHRGWVNQGLSMIIRICRKAPSGHRTSPRPVAFLKPWTGC